jgi:hypothetical protein
MVPITPSFGISYQQVKPTRVTNYCEITVCALEIEQRPMQMPLSSAYVFRYETGRALEGK